MDITMIGLRARRKFFVSHATFPNIYTHRRGRALCFFCPARGGHLGALAHLLCTWGVRWNARATLNVSSLEAPCPNSIFLKICLGLAVRPVPSPSSPPSIARADLVAGTTVVSLLFLYFFLKKNNSYLYDLDRYLYNFLTFIIVCYYIAPWLWYPPPSALVLSMIRMWYIILYYYLFHLVFMTIMPTNVT